MTPTSTNLTDAVTTPADARDDAPEYRVPARFAVGEAVELLRQNISGHLRDGTGGWYVWGS